MIFERLLFLFGEESIARLSEARVAVIGLGGVGGIAAISLARSGVGRILICDYDIIEETNINRQIVANHSTIGLYKADVLYNIIKDINPNCEVIKINSRVTEEILDNVDYLIDAIDDVKAKKELITNCLSHNIIFISSMGAGKKIKPDKISVTTLHKTTYDPIAKILRHHFIDIDFPVVSSTEEVKIDKLGSYMPVVASFGLLLSDYIIKEIIRR